MSSSSADSVVAQQSAQSGDNAGSSDDTVNGHAPSGTRMGVDIDMVQRMLDLNTTINTTLTINGCTAAVSGDIDATDGDATVAINVNFTGACTGKQSISGTEAVNGTWDGNNRKLEVTDNLTRTLTDGDTVKISALEAAQATYELSTDQLPSNGNVVLNVLINEHRVRESGSKVIFDHNITASKSDDLTVTNSYNTSGIIAKATSRTINGTINVHHNLAKFQATNDFTDVTRDLTGTCACPSSGTLVQTVTKDDNSGSYTRTYTFTGCGEATVVTSASTLSGTDNGSATITWDDCTE